MVCELPQGQAGGQRHPGRQPAEGDGPIEDVCGRGGGLSVLCLAGCASTRQATSSHNEQLKVLSQETEQVRAESFELARDTLIEVTTVTVQLNEVGDTVKTSTVTDRTRARAFDRRKDVEIRTEIVRDTVYIEKIDSVYVSTTNLTNPTDTTKGSGLSELFLCHDSGKPKRAWSLRSLLHRFRATLKWIFWILIGLIGLIITMKVCTLRR